ncbi:MAG: acylase [Gammaproteobacteria bacterium]|nr:acylase [Gammaproteobacteria bacterium]
MKHRSPALTSLLCLVLLSCSRDPETVASAQPGPANPSTANEINWDSWGVAHISAPDDQAFFFADGWAQMRAHGNTILKLYGKSRGRAAEYWGESYLASDSLVHRLGHPEFSDTLWKLQAPESHSMYQAFVAGMNAYARAYPGAIEAENRHVLPIEPRDVNLHVLFVTNMRFLAGRELQLGQSWSQKGSNAIAIGPARSSSTHALLLQNPHLPWADEFLWFEKHLLADNRNIYGVSLVGMPGFNIAFNEHLGWTHTVNTIDTADLYELELSGNNYLFDGKPVPFREARLSLKVKRENGDMESRALLVRSSIHGPVIAETNEKALALRIAGKSAIDFHQQFWRMANARSFSEFESALKMGQLPFFNVIYADREDNIFYLSNGHVPRRPHGDWAYWQGTVAGGNSANLWYEHHAYDELPRLLNPASGWLQNANDPPWTSTIPMQLDSADFPPYMSPRGMALRPQRAAQMIVADASISFEELVAIKHDTRMALADRLLDDLQLAVAEYGDGPAVEAMQVLEAWDRQADNDSRGAVLFLHWALNAIRGGPGIFSSPWDPELPLSTPDGLADPQGQAQHLSSVAQDLKARFGRLDIPWGEYNRIEHGDISLPANGAIGQLGVFRVAAARPTRGDRQAVTGGDSWVAIIEFGDPIHAEVLLSYGNSSESGSPHNGDQLKLFSAKKLRRALFTQSQVAAGVSWTEKRQGAGFVRVPD